MQPVLQHCELLGHHQTIHSPQGTHLSSLGRDQNLSPEEEAVTNFSEETTGVSLLSPVTCG